MALDWKIFISWAGTAIKNLCTNPSFETNQTGWTVISGTFATNARSTEQAYAGSYSNKLVNSSGSDALYGYDWTATAATSTISIWVYRSSGAGAITLWLQEDFAPFTVITSVSANSTTGVWQRLTVTGATTATSAYRLRVDVATGVTCYLDAAQAEAGSIATPYYDGAVGDESGNLMEIQTQRGRKHLVRGANGFEPMGIGEASLVLRNSDGRYDPLNTSSPLYDAVAPGKEVRVQVGENGTYYNIFTGHIQDIKPITNGSVARVQVLVRDGWQWLKDRTVRLAAQANYRTDEALNALRGAVNYPFSSSIYVGVDTIPYWWAGNRDAMTEMHSVSDSEFGLLWIAADGTLTFRRRPYQWFLSASHTLTGLNINELNFAQPWEVMRNVIQIRVYPIEQRTKQILWKSQGMLKVRSGKTITLNVKYNLRTGQDEQALAMNVRAAALSIDNPAKTVDVIASATEGGIGPDESTGLTITVTNKGEEGTIVITNNRAYTLWISRLQLKGRVIIFNNAVTVETDSSGSDPERSFVLDLPWQQNVEKAQLYADYLSTFMMDPRAAPTVRTNRAGLAIQCAELFTGIQFTIASLGLSAKLYRLCGVAHEWNALSHNVLQTQMFLERKDETGYFTLDTSQLDGADVLAY